MADYYLIEFTVRAGVRVYNALDKQHAIQQARGCVESLEGIGSVSIDIEDVLSVEEMEDD